MNYSGIKCVAFDCFGTIFDMDSVPREEIQEYVRHVRANDFSPYRFPNSWYALKCHSDAMTGISKLQGAGLWCVTLSNGSVDLLRHVSEAGGIHWNAYIDLAKHQVYKPHVDAYRTPEKEFGVLPAETLMVTANPTFGDLEGAAAVGMRAQTIRHGRPNTVIELAEMMLANPCS